ncbi:hypothetical protein [Shewanella sp. FJAT-52076]|uniref:hypothetical protein n=1 Tax=Shewanella sp. FJAT-52076 TaxID=2864202 RepID=UPI0021ABBBAF|nr:hypothetical protein [Shewanella sp. FJAT-52076]
MKYVNLSIPASVLAKLIYEGQLCAADFQCLDSESKRELWQLCLWACKKRVGCKKTAQLIATTNIIGIPDADIRTMPEMNGCFDVDYEKDDAAMPDECAACAFDCNKQGE